MLVLEPPSETKDETEMEAKEGEGVRGSGGERKNDMRKAERGGSLKLFSVLISPVIH